jgi:DNA recombination-dependent growth factor C
MKQCDRLETCPLFRKYKNAENKNYALTGFIHVYCKGDKHAECVRKKLSKALGGVDKIPANMMPSGMPVFGTLTDNWSAEVKALQLTLKP